MTRRRRTAADYAYGSYSVSYAYDNGGRLLCTTAGGRTLTYEYDPAGNRIHTTWPDTTPFFVTTSFDALNRPTVIKELGTKVLANYSDYDDLSRRRTVTLGNGTTTGYTPNGLNQYTDVAGTAFGYDKNGNLTGDGLWSYDYDSDNRLTGATKTGVSAALAYDAEGRLRQTAIGSDDTNLLYDGNRLVAEYDEAGTLLRRYVHGPGIDEPLMTYEGSNLIRRWFYADHQGSVVAIANNPGAAIAIHSYGPFGEPNTNTGARFRYTGQQFIRQLGLYHYKARFYSPTLGRFLQTDPIGLEGGMNLYAYVGNDPVNLVDPMGLKTYGIDFSGIVGAGGGVTGGETLVIDSNGNYGIVDHAGAGGLGGATGSVSAQIQFTNANSIHDLGGISSSVVGSVGPGVQGTGERILAKDYTGWSAGIGGGPGLPVESHFMLEHATVRHKGKIWEDLGNAWEWLTSDDCP